MSTYSVADVANLICSAHGWKADAQAKVHRQIKHWRSEELITPFARQTDARGTDRFDGTAVCRARFLIVLADIGMDIADMRTALWMLDRENQLAMAIKAIAGRNMPFTCFVRIGRDGAGRKLVTASIDKSYPSEHTITDVDRDIAESRDFYDQADILVSLDRILAPLLKVLPGA